MPTRLARWVCVLTALAAGSTFAADKPKEKKDKPASPPANGGIASGIGALIGQATGNPKTGAVIGGLLGSDVGTLIGNEPGSRSNKFTITKPVGTWVRDVQLKEGAIRVHLTITDDRVVLKAELTDGKDIATVRFDADYAINKESCLFGVLDTFDTDQPISGQAGNLPSLSGQPFAVRFRTDDKTLSVKEFKGFGVGLTESLDDNMKKMLLAVCGQYTAVDPSKPLPELKVKGSAESRLDRVPYPTPHYLKHYPTYIAPGPAFPLQRERDEMLDPTGENTRRGVIAAAALGVPSGVCTPSTPTTSAYAGPIGGAMATPSRSDAAVVQAKAEVSVVEPPRLIPILREDDCPTCDGTPTDAEVMQRFNAKVFKDASPGFEASHDDIVIVKNLVSNKTDAPRYYPLVGFAQTHCCRWECGVYYRDPKSGKGKVEVITIESSSLRIPVAADDPSVKMLQRMTEK